MNNTQKKVERRKRRERGYMHPTKKRAGPKGQTYKQLVAPRDAEAMWAE